MTSGGPNGFPVKRPSTTLPLKNVINGHKNGSCHRDDDHSHGICRDRAASCTQDTSLCHPHNHCTSDKMEKKCRKNGKIGETGGSHDTFSSVEPVPATRGVCDVIEEQLEHLGKGTTWLAIFLGQVLSCVLCTSAVSCVYLHDMYNIHIPNAQNFAFYIVLATIFTTILACRPAERNLFPILKTRGWKYALVALADAEANFLVGKAYQFTTITSAQLLDCFTIPTVLSLSWLVLRIRFKVPHILGVSICLLGVCCLVWADVEDGKPLPAGKDRFLGDMLCLSGAFLHGFSNVAQEFVVKTFDVVEFLGMIGLFGSFVSGAQTVLLEYGEVTSVDWSSSPSTPITLIITFAATQFTFYVLSAVVMKLSGATAFNLSVLTADYYSLIVGIYLFQFKFHALYFLSFVLVMTGVIVFSIKPTEIASHIYRSLTREHTTTLDLELMASTPSSTIYSPPQEAHTKSTHHNPVDEECMLAPSSKNLCVPEESSCLLTEHGENNDNDECEIDINNQSESLLSSQSCDVVLQTTGNGKVCTESGNSGRIGVGRTTKKNGLENNGTYVIPEDEVC